MNAATYNANQAAEKMGEAITAKLLEMMGDGSDAAMVLWRKSLARWTADGMPYNADTGRQYSGGNVIQLLLHRDNAGFTSNGWMTMTAMQKHGFTIVKGCKAPWAWVLSPRMKLTRKDSKGNPIPDKDGNPSTFMGPQRAYKVFNVDCIDTHGKKLPGHRARDKAASEITAEPDYDQLNAMVTHHDINLTHAGNEAYYQPRADKITLPAKSQFTNELSYYAVLAHECTHWTGHKDRLNRDQSGGFGSADYAYEELVAELGSAFVLAVFGLPNDQMPQHANYLKGWIKKLKDDKLFILKASTQASRAAQYLTEPVVSTLGEDVPAAQ